MIIKIKFTKHNGLRFMKKCKNCGGYFWTHKLLRKLDYKCLYKDHKLFKNGNKNSERSEEN